MTVIRLPNILSAVSELQWRVNSAEEEVTQASEAWFSRSAFAFSEFFYMALMNYCV